MSDVKLTVDTIAELQAENERLNYLATRLLEKIKCFMTS